MFANINIYSRKESVFFENFLVGKDSLQKDRGIRIFIQLMSYPLSQIVRNFLCHVLGHDGVERYLDFVTAYNEVTDEFDCRTERLFE